MRLWSLHPRYLDRAGLLGLWRESLGALAALNGRGGSYCKHPQLNRFKESGFALGFMVSYLIEVAHEMEQRGYRPNWDKVPPYPQEGCIPVTVGQVQYEAQRLYNKLLDRSEISRAGVLHRDLEDGLISTHPIFVYIDGPVEEWEKV